MRAPLASPRGPTTSPVITPSLSSPTTAPLGAPARSGVRAVPWRCDQGARSHLDERRPGVRHAGPGRPTATDCARVLPRPGQADRADLQPRLRVLLLPVEGGAVPRRPVPHDRRAARRPTSASSSSPSIGPEVTIAWQGGEPTLMGVDFFRRAVELAEQLPPARPERPAHHPDQRHPAHRRVVRAAAPSTSSWWASASTGRPTLHDALPGRQAGQPDLRQGAARPRAARRRTASTSTCCARSTPPTRTTPSRCTATSATTSAPATSSSSPSSSATTTPGSRRATRSPTARSTPRPGAGS